MIRSDAITLQAEAAQRGNFSFPYLGTDAEILQLDPDDAVKSDALAICDACLIALFVICGLLGAFVIGASA